MNPKISITILISMDWRKYWEAEGKLFVGGRGMN
jgi:hypothetical protein